MNALYQDSPSLLFSSIVENAGFGRGVPAGHAAQLAEGHDHRLRRDALVEPEHDGPPVSAPTHRGFGSIMVEKALA